MNQKVMVVHVPPRVMITEFMPKQKACELQPTAKNFKTRI